MKGLVIQKNSFTSNGKTYENVYLTVKDSKGNLRVSMDARSSFKNIRSYFLPHNVYTSVEVGKVYDFEFEANKETGATNISGCKTATF